MCWYGREIIFDWAVTGFVLVKLGLSGSWLPLSQLEVGSSAYGKFDEYECLPGCRRTGRHGRRLNLSD